MDWKSKKTISLQQHPVYAGLVAETRRDMTCSIYLEVTIGVC